MADIDAPVKLQQRTVVGKGLNHMRRDGVVPAVIHNHGQDSIHVMAPETELVKVYQAAGKHHPLNLEVGTKVPNIDHYFFPVIIILLIIIYLVTVWELAKSPQRRRALVKGLREDWAYFFKK